MRLAVIGLGFMGSTHLKALRNVPEADLVAICSTDERKLTGDLSGIQGNLGGPGERFDFSKLRKYKSIEEVLADSDVEAVDICLPTDLHSSTALSALRAGKHVLVEKPIALTGELADELVVEAERCGRILMAGQVLRFVPAYAGLADALRGDTFGPVRSALFRRRCAAPGWSAWLGDAARSGGGVFDLLIHDADMCLMLFGTPASVSASGFEDMANGVDVIHAQLNYSRGLTVTITGGWHHRKAYPFSMEYTVVSDGATFEYNSLRGNDALLYAANGEQSLLPAPSADAFEAELRYFAGCVNRNKQPELCPPRESAAAVKLMARIVESRRLGGTTLELA